MSAIETTSPSPLTPREFAKIRELAYDTFGLDLRAGKEVLVAARLGKQMREHGCRTVDEYYRRVTSDSTGQLLIQLIDALTTNHTSFFREPAHFDFLRQRVKSDWAGRESIRIWSAACSTGEEPYSIAMCLLDDLGALAHRMVRILATDISTRVLDAAGKGAYPAERLVGLSATQLRSHWTRGGREWAGWYRPTRELRSLIEFRRLNLLDSVTSAGTFPIIFCRNVMIYFDKPTQRQVVERLVRCLEPGGYLLTGHAESLNGLDHGLKYVQPAVYRKASSQGRQDGRSR